MAAPVKQLLDELRGQLNSSEQIEAYLVGGLPMPHKSILAITNTRLVIYRKTITGFHFEGVPYAQISSMQSGKGMFGYSVNAFGANNMLGIRLVKTDDAPAFVNTARQKIAEANAAKKKPSADSPDLSHKIVELDRLRQQGLITEEEYVAKKKQLLGI